jgi:hypothetical protein
MEKGVFEQDAVEFIQNLSEQLKEKLKDAEERNIGRKQNKAKHSQQRTLFEYFQNESEKLNSGVLDASEYEF